MRFECYFCHTKTVEKLINKFKPDQDTAEEFVFAINTLLSENRKLANPHLATYIHRLAKSTINHANLYAEEKCHANDVLLSKYITWKTLVNSSCNPMYLAARLAVTGNIIDYGAHSAPDDIEAQIHELLNTSLAIDEAEELFIKIRNANSILYLGDNAGEIVFDKLFIETMNHPNVTYVVRGKPVINDVTFEDAAHTGMPEVCKVISNGFDAPSTILKHCSAEFLNLYHKADLIIAKGQGNFEGLMNENRENLFFLLMAKCKPMAELLGVNKGDMVIIEQKIHSQCRLKLP